MRPSPVSPRSPAACGPRLPATAAVGVMALLALMLATAQTWSAPASASTATPLVSSASGRCLDVKGNVDTPGTALDIQDCDNRPNRTFEFTSAGELRAMGGTRCVDGYGNGSAPGTPVIIWSCNGESNQAWRQNADGTVTGVQSGLFLDVNGAGTANGTAVILWTCNGQSNQKWAEPTPQPPSGGSGPCDLHSAGGTPCVAAHSTVRALYGSYSGSLYQVQASFGQLRDGGLPGGYSPMRKQGAIVLGSGGDCCKSGGGANLSAGTFYEGAIVAGYPSDATDNAVRANVTAAGYR